MSPTTSTGSTTTSPSAASSSSSTTAMAPIDKNMFLQLLVAQLQNQDPLNPTDSSTFVTQLAQFEQLETSINSGQDISAIRTDADTILSGMTATGSSGGTTSGGTTTGSPATGGS